MFSIILFDNVYFFETICIYHFLKIFLISRPTEMLVRRAVFSVAGRGMY